MKCTSNVDPLAFRIFRLQHLIKKNIRNGVNDTITSNHIEWDKRYRNVITHTFLSEGCILFVTQCARISTVAHFDQVQTGRTRQISLEYFFVLDGMEPEHILKIELDTTVGIITTETFISWGKNRPGWIWTQQDLFCVASFPHKGAHLHKVVLFTKYFGCFVGCDWRY